MTLMTNVPKPASDRPVPQLNPYDARDLVKDGVQACIIRDDQTYYMRITRAGKLILTK